MNWTPEENTELLAFVDENDLQTSFEMFANEKGRNTQTVARHYYRLKENQNTTMDNVENKGVSNAKQWGTESERRLVRMVENGYTYEQISEHFCRTVDACKQKYLGILRAKKAEKAKLEQTKTTRVPIAEWQQKQEALHKPLEVKLEEAIPAPTPIEERNVIGLLLGTEIRIPVTVRFDMQNSELVLTCV